MPILCLASAGWETDTPVNVHHLMRHLSRQHPILWVDSQPMRFPRFTRSDLRKVFRRVRSAPKGFRHLEENIWGMTPKTVPLYGSGQVRRWNDNRLRKSISHAATALGLHPLILWAFLPNAAGLAGTLGEVLTIYHCVDDYAANPGVDSQAIAAMERELLPKVDVVFATSMPLVERLRQHHSNVHWVPAGVDESFFRDSPVPQPADLADIPPPRIGFVGAVSGYKVDIPLVVDASRMYPDISFVLIGPVGEGDPSTDVSELRRGKNVFILGPRDHRHIPEYLHHMDAMMLPSAPTTTMKSSFPVKLFEYFATGKPVIAISQDPLMSYSSLITLVESGSEFLGAIPRVLEDSAPSRVKARVEVARQNTWENRIRRIGEIVEDALAAKLRQV
jgi:glycosyltransferase involved in cell wall biosynthesis